MPIEPPKGHRLATVEDDGQRMGRGWMDWNGESWQPIGNIGCVYMHCKVPVAIPLAGLDA